MEMKNGLPNCEITNSAVLLEREVKGLDIFSNHCKKMCCMESSYRRRLDCDAVKLNGIIQEIQYSFVFLHATLCPRFSPAFSRNRDSTFRDFTRTLAWRNVDIMLREKIRRS